MSWGTKITLLYSAFVILIVAMVVLAMQQRMDLVSKDYYEQELKFQDRINSAANLSALQEPLIVDIKGDALVLQFPQHFRAQEITGTISLLRLSDEAQDHVIPISADAEGRQSIAISSFKRGVYKLTVNWTSGGKGYYFEDMIKL
jgi:hypothetical protein